MKSLLMRVFGIDPDVNHKASKTEESQHIHEVMARAERRLDEQRAHTERAIAGNPITHRLRARPTARRGEHNVSPD